METAFHEDEKSNILLLKNVKAMLWSTVINWLINFAAARYVGELNIGEVGKLNIGEVGKLNIGKVGKLNIGKVGKLNIGEVGKLNIGEVGKLNIGKVGKLNIGEVGKLNIGKVGKLNIGEVGKLNIGENLNSEIVGVSWCHLIFTNNYHTQANSCSSPSLSK